MPTYKYKTIARQGDFVDMQQNSPTAPRQDEYYVGETEDVTGVSMMSNKKVSKVRELYHKSKGALGIVNKALGGRFGPY